MYNGDTLANAGTAMTIGGIAGLITIWSKSESNTDYQRISTTTQRKDTATVAAYSS